METGFDGGTATLAAMSDGTASLYLSNGGGVIGGVQHATVRRAAMEFVRSVGRRLTEFRATERTPLPRVGRTVFYVLTDSGVYTAEADEQALGEQRHALSELFHSGDDVITQLRLVAETK
ncbi:MAG: hypothetical protein ACKVWV_17510 [Planctomycetota bacterium]